MHPVPESAVTTRETNKLKERRKKTRFSGNHDKAADPAPDEECTRPKTVQSQENHSEPTYRPLGDRLGLAEPAQKAHKR